MLVNLYKSKTPLSVFTLPLIIGLVCLSLFFDEPGTNHYFFLWQTDLFNPLQKITWLNYLLTVGLISLNAYQLNNVFNQNSFYSKATSLPGFIYVAGLITFKSLDFSPLIIAHLFLIGALSKLLQLKRQEPSKDIIFKGSFLIGLAVIFSPAMISLFLLPWIALILIKPIIWREWVMALLGISLPIMYHFAFHYLLTDNAQLIIMPVAKEVPHLTWTILDSLTYILAAACILVGVFKFILTIRSQIVSFKKMSQIVLWMAVLTSLSFGIGWYFYGELYLSFVLPIAFIISIQLLNAGRVKLANTLVLSWFIISAVNLFV